MSLRDRIARVLCANSPANTEGSAFEDYAGCNQREWLETADSILVDPEIAALIEVAEKAKAYRSVSVPLMAAGYTAEPCGVEEDKELFAALARLEEARRD